MSSADARIVAAGARKATVVSFGDDVLERMILAVEQVRDRLRRATSALESACVTYAVVGGNAVAAWVSRIDPAAARNTVDVDLLLRREDFNLAKTALESAGFCYSFTFGVHAFVDGPNGKAREAIHVLFANENVKENDLSPAPDLLITERYEGYHVIDLDSLVAMKLTAFRRKDQVHIQDMIEVGLLDDSWLVRLPEELRPRLKELLDDPHG